MKRIAGAAALAYVVLAAIENMELLGMPGLGAPTAEIRAAYADRALGVVTVSAGGLSLLAYVVFAAAWRPRRLWAAAGAAGLAGAGVAAAATFDPSQLDLQLTLRYLAGPLMGVFLLGASRLATVVALPLLLTPLALAGLELPAQLAFAAQAALIWLIGLRLSVGSVRNAAFLMLVVAAGAVGVALLIVPDATGAFFSWELKPASLAAFAGGVYVSSAVVYAARLMEAPERAAALAQAVAGRHRLGAGSWTLTLATLATWAALRHDARLPTLALIALPIGALVGALRTEADPAYLVALVLLALVSAAPDAVARTARRLRRDPHPTLAPPVSV